MSLTFAFLIGLLTGLRSLTPAAAIAWAVPRLAAPTTFARVDGYVNRRRYLQRPRAV